MASVSCGGKNLQLVGEMVGESGSGGAVGSEGGTNQGGTGKVGSPVGAAAGEGNDGGDLNADGSPEQPTAGTVFFEGLSPVRGIAADATTLYWVEYGSNDSLGNFQNDGRLLARDFDAEDVRVLADDLPGAVNVAVTSTHAFVYVDQWYDGGPRSALMRMTLEGEASEVVAPDVSTFPGGGVCLRCLVASDSTAYYIGDEAISRIAADETSPSVFVKGFVNAISVNGDSLYYTDSGGVWQAALDTGSPVKISTQVRRHLQTAGDFAYGLDEDGEATYLARMPLAGGNWTRLEPKHPAMYAWQLQLFGDLFFHDLHLSDGRWQVVQGLLSDTANAQVVAEVPTAEPLRAWVGTPAGVFWSDESRVLYAPPASQ